MCIFLILAAGEHLRAYVTNIHRFPILRSAPLPGGIQGSHDLEEKSSYAQIDDLRSVIGSASKSRKGHDWDSNFYSAESHWAEWAQFVNHASSGAGRNRSDNSSLSKLLNVVPQIKSCVLQVLNGTASPESHSHWSEALLVELVSRRHIIFTMLFFMY